MTWLTDAVGPGSLARVEVRPAEPGDVEAVVTVLAEAAAWVRSKGIDQWPTRFPRRLVAEAVERGEVFVAACGDEVVGTVTVQHSDAPLWGDRDDALFVHRLAVRRSHAGLGQMVMSWADGQARELGKQFLCLDCMADNPGLRAYYERLGFRQVGEVWDGGRVTALFERPCAG